MASNHTSLKNPGLHWSLIIALWVGFSFLFITSPAKWALGIPVATWLFGLGGLVSIVICLYSIIAMQKWEEQN
jgi:hypothetical protein